MTQLGDLSPKNRGITRPVALAYRRAYRAGDHSPRNLGRTQLEAVDAAMAEYRRLVPDAPEGDVACSKIVLPIIAAAISANTDWFWQGPDA